MVLFCIAYFQPNIQVFHNMLVDRIEKGKELIHHRLSNPYAKIVD